MVVRNGCRTRQVRLRTLFFGVVIAAAVAAYVGYEKRQVAREMRALHLLQGAGNCEYQLAESIIPKPIWCRHIVGLELNGDLPDGTLRYLAEFTKLGSLTVNCIAFDDKLLAHVRLPYSVFYLDLSNTAISDGAMKEVSRLGNLVHLRLNETDITDAGVQHLSQLKSLTILEAASTNLTDGSISVFVNLRNLRELDVRWTQISEIGCADFVDKRDDVMLLH